MTIIILSNRLILMQQSEKRLASGSQLRYEPCDVVQPPQETPDLLLSMWLGHLEDRFYLVRIHLYSFLANKAKQFFGFYLERTLCRIQP